MFKWFLFNHCILKFQISYIFDKYSQKQFKKEDSLCSHVLCYCSRKMLGEKIKFIEIKKPLLLYIIES